MCNMIHVIAFLSSPSEFQTLCVHLASVSIVRIWYCGVSSWFWLDFLVLLTGPCPRSLPALSLLFDPPTRCHRQPSNQHSQSASNQENCSSSSSSLTEDANACLDKQLVDDIELLANGFHDQRINRACCHALHAATATVGERSCLFIGCFCFSWWSNLAAPSCHLLQLTPSRELMSTVFAAKPGDRFSKDSKACNCNPHYSLTLDPQPWSRPSRALWSWQWTSSAPPARTRCPSTSGCPCDCRPPPAVDYDWRFFSSQTNKTKGLTL